MAGKTLPENVIEKDRRLTKSADELAKLRWHWTLDKSNPGKLNFTDYANQVGATRQAVSVMAIGYESFLESARNHVVAGPGVPQTLGDHIQLAKLGEENQMAVKAIAAASGTTITNVAAHKGDQVASVIGVARERAVANNTTVEHEIAEEAEWRAKAQRVNKAESDKRKQNRTAAFIRMENLIGSAMRKLRVALDEAEGIEFEGDELEVLTDTLGRLRGLIKLLDLRIVGTVDIDWDRELEKITS